MQKETKQNGNPKKDKIDEIFSDEKQITETLQRAVHEAVLTHKHAGNPVATWRNGKAVWVGKNDLEQELLAQEEANEKDFTKFEGRIIFRDKIKIYLTTLFPKLNFKLRLRQSPRPDKPAALLHTAQILRAFPAVYKHTNIRFRRSA